MVLSVGALTYQAGDAGRLLTITDNCNITWLSRNKCKKEKCLVNPLKTDNFAHF